MNMILAYSSKMQSESLVFGADLRAKAVLTSLDWLSILSGNGLWICAEKSSEVGKGRVSPVSK